ncbi:MAG: hypothetical protein GWP19_00850 [Planctomycetia bacterium]|nr:hypothetical protein [Planctomycetia bacterium]
MAIKTLFTTIEQIQDYITVDVSSNERTILPYMLQAEKFTTEIVGKALRADLIEVVHGNNDEEKLKDLLKIVRLPLANFGYMLATEKMNVNVGEKGFTVTENQNLAPASQWRVDNFRESVKQSGYDGLEDLLEFLEDNVKHYPHWEMSKAYSFNKQFFINNAEEFKTAIKKEITRVKFLNLKPFIHQIERSYIRKTTCPRLFDVIKNEILGGKVSPNNLKLLNEYIRPAVCYLALDKKEENENWELEGIGYVEELQDFLNNNADNYPDYKISNCHKDPTVEVEEKNNEDSGFYIFGG